MENIFQKQLEFFSTGVTCDYAFRKLQLEKLQQSLVTHEDKIKDALMADLGKSGFETYLSEIMMVKHEISYALKNLKSWIKPKKVSSVLTLLPSKSVVYPEPKGVVLIISPWNYPIQLTLSPLIASIAAGCCSIIKPSEFSHASSEVLREMISETFPETYVSVALGGAGTSEELLKLPFDHIFFTGSPRVGKLVMAQAAQNLTPVTLELGGKSPCIVDANADIKSAAKKIAWGKFLNAGQTCIAPDYILVFEGIAERLKSEIKSVIAEFYGDMPLKNNEYPKIISERHFDRLTSLMNDGKIYCGGASDKSSMKIEPTVISSPSLSSPLMQEEIFGPILPIITIKNIEDAIKFITQRPKPLALYIFTNTEANADMVINRIQFGSGAVNEVVMQIVNPNMPFGGIGASGMGSYHGKAGFDTFTHYKSILKRYNFFDSGLQYPPYDKKPALLRKLLKYL